MFLTTVLLLIAAGLIYLSCEFFVNGIEWMGAKMNLGATATGTVLAAFGTALPESAVTFTAVAFGKGAEKELGVGAALGGPLVLATIAYGIVGIALLKARSARPAEGLVRANHKNLARDQASFLGIFAFKVGLGYLAFHGKPYVALLFVLAYGLYVWREIVAADSESEEQFLEPLKLQPSAENPSLAWVILQIVLALAVISAASHLFVVQLGRIELLLGIPAHLAALLLSPIATELPETMNAIIWVRAGKERLALANISGAMMIQATIPSALGIYFTPWLFDSLLSVAAGVTALAIFYLWLIFRKGAVQAKALAFSAAFYLIFAAYVGFHWLCR